MKFKTNQGYIIVENYEVKQQVGFVEPAELKRAMREYKHMTIKNSPQS